MSFKNFRDRAREAGHGGGRSGQTKNKIKEWKVEEKRGWRGSQRGDAQERQSENETFSLAGLLTGDPANLGKSEVLLNFLIEICNR